MIAGINLLFSMESPEHGEVPNDTTVTNLEPVMIYTLTPMP